MIGYSNKKMNIKWPKDIEEIYTEPSIETALSKACKKQVPLVVYSLNQLPESLMKCLEIIDKLRKRKTKLIVLKEELDTGDAFGKLNTRMQLIFRDSDIETIDQASKHPAISGLLTNIKHKTNSKPRGATMSEELEQTAIHEAGHFVAGFIVSQCQEGPSIVPNPDKGTLGHLIGEGEYSVWDAEDAKEMIFSFLAGYAALIGAGYDYKTASQGAEGDFERTKGLIDYWGLNETIDEMKEEAVVIMRQEQNINAVNLIKNKLLKEGDLSHQQCEMLIYIARGDADEEDYQRMCA